MATRGRRLVVAINPTASFGSTRDVGPAVVQTLRASGHRVTSLTEPDFESLADAARDAVADRPDALVVVGGDGMVNLAANVLAESRVPLGIVPSGTGNDSARGLGIPHRDTEAAIRALDAALARAPRAIDLGRATWTDADSGAPHSRWFAGALSAGFDALVNERANAMRRPRGSSRYTIALLAELLRLSPRSYRIRLDGSEVETEAVLVAAANNVSIGGGMRITPDALVDDGLLDLFVVARVSRARFLRLFPKVFAGAHTGLSVVRIERGRRIRIEAEGIVAYADGERFGPLPVDVEVVPGALRVLA